MTKEVFTFKKGDSKTIEKVLFDENLHYLHMIFNKGDFLPVHLSNSTVYMTVLRGTLSLALNDGDLCRHGGGTLLKIAFQTKMDVKNLDEDVLELIVVKAPAPLS